MSSVSWAMRFRFSGGKASRVFMLCRRSASLIKTTRMSSAMETSIFRKLSAWSDSASSIGPATSSAGGWSLSSMRVNLVTPSTSLLTSGPKRRVISSRETPQSSTTSWSRAATIVWVSRWRSARKRAVSRGWAM